MAKCILYVDDIGCVGFVAVDSFGVQRNRTPKTKSTNRLEMFFFFLLLICVFVFDINCDECDECGLPVCTDIQLSCISL